MDLVLAIALLIGIVWMLQRTWRSRGWPAFVSWFGFALVLAGPALVIFAVSKQPDDLGKGPAALACFYCISFPGLLIAILGIVLDKRRIPKGT